MVQKLKDKWFKKEILITAVVMAVLTWFANEGLATIDAIEGYPQVKNDIEELKKCSTEQKTDVEVLKSEIKSIKANTDRMLDIMLKKSQ